MLNKTIPELIDWIETYIPDDFYYIRIARVKVHDIPAILHGNAVEPTHKHHLAIMS